MKSQVEHSDNQVFFWLEFSVSKNNFEERKGCKIKDLKHLLQYSPGYTTGNWLHHWELATLLGTSYTTGNWLHHWELATPLGTGYTTGN